MFLPAPLPSRQHGPPCGGPSSLDISPLRGEDLITVDYYKHSTTPWLHALLAEGLCTISSRPYRMRPRNPGFILSLARIRAWLLRGRPSFASKLFTPERGGHGGPPVRD